MDEFVTELEKLRREHAREFDGIPMEYSPSLCVRIVACHRPCAELPPVLRLDGRPLRLRGGPDSGSGVARDGSALSKCLSEIGSSTASNAALSMASRSWRIFPGNASVNRRRPASTVIEILERASIADSVDRK